MQRFKCSSVVVFCVLIHAKKSRGTHVLPTRVPIKCSLGSFNPFLRVRNARHTTCLPCIAREPFNHTSYIVHRTSYIVHRRRQPPTVSSHSFALALRNSRASAGTFQIVHRTSYLVHRQTHFQMRLPGSCGKCLAMAGRTG